MKTIRYQLKTSKCFIIVDTYLGGHLDLSLFNFFPVTK